MCLKALEGKQERKREEAGYWIQKGPVRAGGVILARGGGEEEEEEESGKMPKLNFKPQTNWSTAKYRYVDLLVSTSKCHAHGLETSSRVMLK